MAIAGPVLGLGLPLTLLATALLARFVVGLPWLDSFLVGAVLSPTDPVFAAAIVGRDEIPIRLRRLLNVESGLNDGLTLPAVVILLAVASGEGIPLGSARLQAVGGIVLGVVVAWVAVRLGQSRYFSAVAIYQPLHGFAIALLVLALAAMLVANQFLAAFAAGVTLGNTGSEVRDAFEEFGNAISELLKLAALLMFGAPMTLNLFASIPRSGYLFAALALLAVRPAALGMSLIGAPLSWYEWTAAVWFGPKGFASVFYGLLVVKSPLPNADRLFYLIALVVAASIIAHSSTDVLIAGWYRKDETEEEPQKSLDVTAENWRPVA